MGAEFVYECLDWHRRIAASVRPTDSPECDGDAIDESFERWRVRAG